MRTTITLEKDVAARLERLKKSRPFKDLVNDALRAGLDEIERQQAKKVRRYTITPVKGEPLRTDLDNVAALLAEVEGDAFK
jgi:metal-responsive CopG/Arc/MetJ family transcriptional regulator